MKLYQDAIVRRLRTTTASPLLPLNCFKRNIYSDSLPSTSASLKRPISALAAGDDEDEGTKRRRIRIEELRENRKKEKLKKQSLMFWELRDFFQTLDETDLASILKFNEQDIPSSRENVLDRLADIALYGKPMGCPECTNGILFYSSSNKTYVCTGYVTEYAKCMNTSKNPVRTPFEFPPDFAHSFASTRLPFNAMVDRIYSEEEPVVGHLEKQKANKVANVMAADEVFSNDGEVLRVSNMRGYKCRQIVKRGTVIDGDFPYAEICHVYRDDNGNLYSATLTFTDLSCNKNSYYKMQLLKEDKASVFYLFLSWGRVGTDVGNCKYPSFYDSESGVEEFKKIFKEKTNNQWEYRKYFRKHPGFFSYIETDYSEFNSMDCSIIPGSQTKLPNSVKDIIISIFNVDNMKEAMKSFEMDINKLPLGKLSQKQIMTAYEVLTQLQDLITEPVQDKIKLMDSTNKFYTIIPHNFGMKMPEPIDTVQKIRDKSKMLDALLDIQFAYDQVRAGNEDVKLTKRDPVDVNYEKLNCELIPLDETDKNYKMVHEYLFNTIGSTHGIKCQLLDVIEIRKDVSKFKRSDNHKLLWHGSGKMNYAGILTQGLRVAPKEAPHSGYMFGKGIYFADMFSKSVFYCRAHEDEEAYILLCEVSLGNQLELTRAQTITKDYLKRENFDSVLGLGIEFPEPDRWNTHEDGYKYPAANSIVKKGFFGSSLLYNE
ncbi:unnamed protein product [Caenorhabditis bovis]|uniref:Poly [ADP-ribose] polymerase n=1 Tax=Caenorhabditis bovis TaxID=2654633 RepID=A0A8S1F252_9PELO|nr:unnamed protein product [Caenorhabditis bovis]